MFLNISGSFGKKLSFVLFFQRYLVCDFVVLLVRVFSGKYQSNVFSAESGGGCFDVIDATSSVKNSGKGDCAGVVDECVVVSALGVGEGTVVWGV